MALLFCVATAAAGGAVFAVHGHAGTFETAAMANAGGGPDGGTGSLAPLPGPVCSQ
jgi:hypothetical protein